MKFGQVLKTTAEDLPEMRTLFTSYKLLKKQLKRLPAKEAIEGHSAPMETLTEEETKFIQKLSEGLQQMNDMFLEREETCIIKLERLQGQAQAASTLDACRAGYKACVDFHGEVLLMMHWSVLAYTATVKILKKHHKRTGLVLRAPHLGDLLSQPFCSTEVMAGLVSKAEETIGTLRHKMAAMGGGAGEEDEPAEAVEITTADAAAAAGPSSGAAAAGGAGGATAAAAGTSRQNSAASMNALGSALQGIVDDDDDDDDDDDSDDENVLASEAGPSAAAANTASAGTGAAAGAPAGAAPAAADLIGSRVSGSAPAAIRPLAGGALLGGGSAAAMEPSITPVAIPISQATAAAAARATVAAAFAQLPRTGATAAAAAAAASSADVASTASAAALAVAAAAALAAPAAAAAGGRPPASADQAQPTDTDEEEETGGSWANNPPASLMRRCQVALTTWERLRSTAHTPSTVLSELPGSKRAKTTHTEGSSC